MILNVNLELQQTRIFKSHEHESIYYSQWRLQKFLIFNIKLILFEKIQKLQFFWDVFE